MRASSRAFSLLEIVLALALFTALALCIFLLLTSGLNLLSFAERSNVANSLGIEMTSRILERDVELTEGDFDGRVLTPQEHGFPPSPYPVKTLGREYRYRVDVKAHDERLWLVKVEVYEDDRRAASLEMLTLR